MWWSASSNTRISLEFMEFLRLRALSGLRYRSVEWSATKCDERLGTRVVEWIPTSAFQCVSTQGFQYFSTQQPWRTIETWHRLACTEKKVDIPARVMPSRLTYQCPLGLLLLKACFGMKICIIGVNFTSR